MIPWSVCLCFNLALCLICLWAILPLCLWVFGSISDLLIPWSRYNAYRNGNNATGACASVYFCNCQPKCRIDPLFFDGHSFQKCNENDLDAPFPYNEVGFSPLFLWFSIENAFLPCILIRKNGQGSYNLTFESLMIDYSLVRLWTHVLLSFSLLFSHFLSFLLSFLAFSLSFCSVFLDFFSRFLHIFLAFPLTSCSAMLALLGQNRNIRPMLRDHPELKMEMMENMDSRFHSPESDEFIRQLAYDMGVWSAFEWSSLDLFISNMCHLPVISCILMGIPWEWS